MFKPWSIVSITAAIVVAFVFWTAMIRFELALVVATATAAATLAYAPAEPYSAIITVLLPPVFVLAWSGLGRARIVTAAGRRSSASGSSLGCRRCSLRLLFLYAAFTLALMGLLVAGAKSAGLRCCGSSSSG